MVSRTSRRIAVPMVVACFGVFGAAEAAHAAGGLSVTPAILEHRAALGTVGSLTLNNTTNETLKVTVNVRPWRQELNGKVLTDPRATFNRYVRATRRSFTLGAGAKVPVTFRMVRRTGSGSLYGNVDILGKPTRTKGRKGIIPQYRLISSIRLHPRSKTIKLRTGAGQIRNRTFVLPVRNLGNTKVRLRTWPTPVRSLTRFGRGCRRSELISRYWGMMPLRPLVRVGLPRMSTLP